MRSISRFFFFFFFFFEYSICDLLDLLYKKQFSFALKSSIHTTMKWLCLQASWVNGSHKGCCSHVGEGKNVLCLIFVPIDALLIIFFFSNVIGMIFIAMWFLKLWLNFGQIVILKVTLILRDKSPRNSVTPIFFFWVKLFLFLLVSIKGPNHQIKNKNSISFGSKMSRTWLFVKRQSQEAQRFFW